MTRQIMTPTFILKEVVEADYTLIQNLIRFYVYDMAEHTGWHCPADGLYGGCDDQPHYFGRLPPDPGERWPEDWTGQGFKILVGDEIAGFCLLRFYAGPDQADGENINDVGEFFVLRKFRRQGLGTAVAHAAFARYSGPWQVRQMPDNIPAQAFWRHCIASFAPDGFSEKRQRDAAYDIDMVVQRFTSPGKDA
jgi:predicted acetyltransferase